jgi:hypothetical protein
VDKQNAKPLLPRSSQGIKWVKSIWQAMGHVLLLDITAAAALKARTAKASLIRASCAERPHIHHPPARPLGATQTTTIVHAITSRDPPPLHQEHR